MGSATPRLSLPYPVGTDTPDVPRDMLALATQLDGYTAWDLHGTLAARPAAGTVGRYYTDENGITYRDSGSAWQPIGGALAIPWTALPFAANWTNLGSGYDPCQYARTISGFTLLRGVAQWTGAAGGSNVNIAVLPVGIRPSTSIWVWALIGAAGTYRVESHNSDGGVYFSGPFAAGQPVFPAGGWVSLAGLWWT